MASDKGEWNPGRKYQTYLNAIQEVLANGEERTVRDVYYALEARGFPEELMQASYQYQLERHQRNSSSWSHPDNLPQSEWLWEFEYEYVKRAVKKGRRSGYIDPNIIFDSSRQPVNVPSYPSYKEPQDYVDQRIRGIWDKYWENFWEYHDTYVEVWLEKQSLATVFNPICKRNAVRLEATRGDWSDSKVHEATQRLKDKIFEGKDVKILYFGDFNPSGYHAPVSVLDTMEYYGLSFTREFPSSDDARYYDPEHGLPITYYDEDVGDIGDEDAKLGSFDLERCGINLSHTEWFDLPENPVPSSSDKDATIKTEFRKHVSDGKDINIELNALKEYHREYLEYLIEKKIEQYIDTDKRDKVNQRIREARNALEDTVDIHDDQLAEVWDPPIEREEA